VKQGFRIASGVAGTDVLGADFSARSDDRAAQGDGCHLIDSALR